MLHLCHVYLVSVVRTLDWTVLFLFCRLVVDQVVTLFVIVGHLLDGWCSVFGVWSVLVFFFPACFPL